MQVAPLFQAKVAPGVSAWRQQTVKLNEGDTGTAQTVELIRQLVQSGIVHPLVRRTATDIVRTAGLQGWDEHAVLNAVYNWVKANITFVRDPLGVTHGVEFLQPAWDTLNSQAGDCDCINAILLPSLLGALGYPTKLVTVSTDPADPSTYSHIYSKVFADGQWIALDVARPDSALGREPERWFKLKEWDLTGGPSNMNGCGCASGMGGVSRFPIPRFGVRRGMRGLGLDTSSEDLGYGVTPVDTTVVMDGSGAGGGFDWNQALPAILTATPNILKGAATIVGAANAPQYPYGVNALGQPIQPGVAVSASSNLLIYAGLAAIALFAFSRRK